MVNEDTKATASHSKAGRIDQSAPASDPGPATMPRRLWVLYPVALASLSVVWGAVLQVLLARQVLDFTSGRAAASVLGIVVSVAAVTGLLASPIMGLLSDRTRTRFLGRRNLWILGSSVVGAAALIVTATSPSTVVLCIVWAVAIWPLNAYQAVMTAILPERVPMRVRGTMSGLAGTSGLVGTFIGVAVAGLAASPIVGYGIVAAQLLAVGAVFAFCTRDVEVTSTRRPARESLRVPHPRQHPNFWWAFVGRFLTFFAYFIVNGMLLFILRDYIHVGDGSTEAASTAIVQVSGISTLFIMVASLFGGVLADKLGRLKLFVVASSLLFIPGAIVLLVVPTFAGILVGMSIAGLGFGMFLAVDQALFARVIPSLDDAGRDLGILAIANGAPQIITPVLAGALIAGLGYTPLFVLMIVFSVLGAVAVMLIKGVR